MKIHLVYIDDSIIQLEQMKLYLEGQKFFDPQYPHESFEFEISIYSNLSEYKKHAGKIDFLLLDMDLKTSPPYQEAKDIISYTLQKYHEATIAMYSGINQDELLIEFLAHGAHNFILKEKKLAHSHSSIIHTYMTSLYKRKSYSNSSFPIDKSRFVGETVVSLANTIAKIIQKKQIKSVFISGETGTGKEVVAQLFKEAIHFMFGRQIPFEIVNSGALSKDIIEAELFGTVKGAFTGAVDKKGIFEIADGGWVFLDEVASLSMSAQNSLMRILENNELKRVGESKIRKVNIRVLSATNENLEKLSKEGLFRHDLIQRLAGTKIELPPLRQRSAIEIDQLIDHFLKIISDDQQFIMATTTRKLLHKYDWRKGNIRELRNALYSMSMFPTSNNMLLPISIPEDILESIKQSKKSQHDTSNLFEFILRVNQANCKKSEIELECFAQLYNNLKLNMSLKKIGELYGISHATAIKFAKILASRNRIELENFSPRISAKRKKEVII